MKAKESRPPGSLQRMVRPLVSLMSRLLGRTEQPADVIRRHRLSGLGRGWTQSQLAPRRYKLRLYLRNLSLKAQVLALKCMVIQVRLVRFLRSCGVSHGVACLVCGVERPNDPSSATDAGEDKR